MAVRRGHPNEGEAVHRYDPALATSTKSTHGRGEMSDLMRCRQVDGRPISGNAANAAIALGFLRGGDAVVVNSTDAGGHISHGPVGVFGRRIQVRGQVLSLAGKNPIPLHTLPVSEDRWHVDVPAAIDLIERVSPRMVVLGKSLFLFPDPVRELAPVCREKGIPLLYDGAKVFGSSRRYVPDPLQEVPLT